MIRAASTLVVFFAVSACTSSKSNFPLCEDIAVNTNADPTGVCTTSGVYETREWADTHFLRVDDGTLIGFEPTESMRLELVAGDWLTIEGNYIKPRLGEVDVYEVFNEATSDHSD